MSTSAVCAFHEGGSKIFDVAKRRKAITEKFDTHYLEYSVNSIHPLVFSNWFWVIWDTLYPNGNTFLYTMFFFSQ